MARFPLAVVPIALALAATPALAQAPAPAFDPITFELVKDSGIGFVTNSSRTAHRHQPETMVSGAAFFDFDNDGLLDVFLTNGARMTELDKTDPVFWNRLYRNLGGFKFEDVTEKAGLKGHGYDNGVATADYDNDGWTDLFVAGLRENVLYRNKGDGTFEDVDREGGAQEPRPRVRHPVGGGGAPSSTTTRTATSTSSSPTTASGTRRRSPCAARGG